MFSALDARATTAVKKCELYVVFIAEASRDFGIKDRPVGHQISAVFCRIIKAQHDVLFIAPVFQVVL